MENLAEHTKIKHIVRHCFNKNLKAFTLAETLITLTIIGIIAAVTVPTLIHTYTEAATISKINKTYSTFSNAFDTLVAEYGPPDIWDNKTNSGLATMFSKKIKTRNICYNIKESCFPKLTYKTLSGVEREDFFWTAQMGQQQDMSVSFQFKSPNCRGWNAYAFEATSEKHPYYHACGTIIVDVNGTKKPNKFGVDTFEFTFTERKLLPSGLNTNSYYDNLNNKCNMKSTSYNDNGLFCTAWVILNKNMKYQKETIRW